MMPTTFYDYKIIVELLCYPLGAVHDAVPPSDTQTDPDAPGQREQTTDLTAALSKPKKRVHHRKPAERRVRGPSGMFFSVSYRTYYQHSCHLVCGITDLTLGVSG
jgi:hypothetical protein